MELDELSNPGTVAVFSAGTEVPAAYDGNLAEQAGDGGCPHEVRYW